MGLDEDAKVALRAAELDAEQAAVARAAGEAGWRSQFHVGHSSWLPAGDPRRAGQARWKAARDRFAVTGAPRDLAAVTRQVTFEVPVDAADPALGAGASPRVTLCDGNVYYGCEPPAGRVLPGGKAAFPLLALDRQWTAADTAGKPPWFRASQVTWEAWNAARAAGHSAAEFTAEAWWAGAIAVAVLAVLVAFLL